MPNQPTATATASGSGIGVFGLTFVSLLVLKLAGVADISWFWVFSPLIAAVALTVIVLFVLVIIALFLDR